MNCPSCGKPLISLGGFDSCPCHFSYKEDAPDMLSGELFECDNEDCDSYEEMFYTDITQPGEIFFGRPEGV